jgi:pyruvate dehydrogenase E1 component beta subunit/2-oxoisovalerate dehydrogenase E1 component
MEWLKNMQRLRCLEETCADLHAQEKITGPVHFSIGEEAVAAGVVGLLNLDDHIAVVNKEHSFALLRGVSSKKIISEMFGRNNHAGDKHFFREGNFVSHGIAKAVEVASLSKNSNVDRRTICFFDEKAIQEAVLHKSMKIARDWSLPILFCCENSDSEELFDKCVVDMEIVDGMNIHDVVMKTKNALQYMKVEKKPYFLDFKTLRSIPYSKNINCPIELLRQNLEKQGLLSMFQWNHLKEDISSELSESVSFAEKFFI